MRDEGRVPIDRPSYWLIRAANALDCAVQLTGDENTNEIDSMEKRCDELAQQYQSKGK